MRRLNRDNLPFMVDCLDRKVRPYWHAFLVRIAAHWWGVRLGAGCYFLGRARFYRYPGSSIIIGADCEFNSSPTSNLIGVNHPCIISTQKAGAEVLIGSGCGFSGTVISCAQKIVIGENVRCGANTLIMDTDWHTGDPRTGPDKPVIINKGVWLGVNVTVLKGVTIGENTFIGAGSLVTRSLPPNVIAAGIPAKILKKIDGTEGREGR